MYATDFTTALANGSVLTDLIPTLKNPFDNTATAVSDVAPTVAGEVGYDTSANPGVGYVITALGKDGSTTIITLTNGS